MRLTVATTAIILVAGLTESLLGILQVAGIAESGHSLYAATGTFFNPGPYGAFLGVVVPVALWCMLTCGNRYMRMLSAITLLGCITMLPGTMSRTGWIAAATGCIPVAVALLRNRWNRLKTGSKILTAGVAATVTVAALTGAYMIKRDSADGRQLIWKVATEAISDNPLSGVGWNEAAGKYGEAQEKYFRESDASETEIRVADAPPFLFNEYLQTALAFGIPAAALLIIIIISGIILLMRRGSPGLCGALVAFAVSCMSSYPLQFIEFRLIFLILTATAAISIRAIPLRVTTLCILFAAGALFQHATQKIDTDAIFAAGRKAYFEGRHKDSNALMIKMLNYTADHTPLTVIGKNYQAMNMPDSAAFYFHRAALRIPNRHYPHYLLMKLHLSENDTANAMKEAKLILSMVPKVPSTAISDMRQEAHNIILTMTER